MTSYRKVCKTLESHYNKRMKIPQSHIKQK